MVWMAWSLNQKNLMDKSRRLKIVAIGKSISKSMENCCTICRQNANTMLWKVWKTAWYGSRKVHKVNWRFKETTSWRNWSQSLNKTSSSWSNRHGRGLERNVSISTCTFGEHKRQKGTTQITRENNLISASPGPITENPWVIDGGCRQHPHNKINKAPKTKQINRLQQINPLQKRNSLIQICTLRRGWWKGN